jgi:hypothetical protein
MITVGFAGSTGKIECIRRARPEDAVVLPALAMRSKAFWGYPADFMESCCQELTVTAGDLRGERQSYFVAETGQEIIGFYGLEYVSAPEPVLSPCS